jgi:hypothetical protein
MRQLLVKSGIKQFDLFENERFPCFEAYLGPNDRLEDLLKTKMKLKVIHMPHAVNQGGQSVAVNFCGDPEVRESSLRKLQEIVRFADAHDVPCVVIHAGFWDCRAQDKNQQINVLAQGLSSLDLGGVTVCVENVPRWVNLCFECEPIISDEKDWCYLQSLWPQAGFACDVDHAALNAVFGEFYNSFQQKAPAVMTHDFRRSMEDEICQAVDCDPSYFQKRVDGAIERMLQSTRPAVIHALGSDFCNYRGFDRLPLTGEALPMAYQGTVSGVQVEDRIRHEQWVSALPENVFITLELMLRLDYNYIDQIKKNWVYLEKLLKKEL